MERLRRGRRHRPARARPADVTDRARHRRPHARRRRRSRSAPRSSPHRTGKTAPQPARTPTARSTPDAPVRAIRIDRSRRRIGQERRQPVGSPKRTSARLVKLELDVVRRVGRRGRWRRRRRGTASRGRGTGRGRRPRRSAWSTARGVVDLRAALAGQRDAGPAPGVRRQPGAVEADAGLRRGVAVRRRRAGSARRAAPPGAAGRPAPRRRAAAAGSSAHLDGDGVGRGVAGARGRRRTSAGEPVAANGVVGGEGDGGQRDDGRRVVVAADRGRAAAPAAAGPATQATGGDGADDGRRGAAGGAATRRGGARWWKGIDQSVACGGRLTQRSAERVRPGCAMRSETYRHRNCNVQPERSSFRQSFVICSSHVGSSTRRTGRRARGETRAR